MSMWEEGKENGHYRIEKSRRVVCWWLFVVAVLSAPATAAAAGGVRFFVIGHSIGHALQASSE